MRNSSFPVQMTGTTNTLLWANEWEIEPQALEQIRKVSKLAPVKYLRVMPDVHMGVGASIGTVIGMQDAIAPSAVGVDIGCGVSAVPTGLVWGHLDDGIPNPADLRKIRAEVEKAIPVGFNVHETPVDIRKRFDLEFEHVNVWSRFDALYADVSHLRGRAEHQLGTLGGGNHFIELCADEYNELWLTLHSGSRNIGKEIAEYHIKLAKGLPHNKGLGDLAYFKKGSDYFTHYLSDLYWAQNYAKTNRTVMMSLFKEVIKKLLPEANFGFEISCHHNYVKNETVDMEELIVTRKGAISAHDGEAGVIPGNMAVGSYVVRGLGSPLSLFSAAHGAGRTMSRGKAKSLISLQELREQTAHIEARKDAGIIDEAPGAYKDFVQVMHAQRDLVEPTSHLQTLMCVKG